MRLSPRAASVAAPPPIYIGGLDRSGKTTMRAFLASHSNIAIPAVGSNMWTYFYRQFGDLGHAENFERCLAAMLRYKHVAFLKPDPDRLRREFAEGAPTYARMFELFLVHFAEREGKPRWGVQTGLIERYADELFAAHPGVKIIHMIRDPRDRYDASIAKWPKGKGRAGGAVARWRYSAKLAERHAQRHPDAYLIVRFEDLIRRPEPTVRDVCAFIGEQFEPSMMRMGGAEKHRALLLDGRTSSDAPILSDRFIGQFRRSVSKPDIAFIQLHTAGPMRAHGYEPDPLDFTRAARLRFACYDWPNQLARMVAWLTVESAQQRLPAIVRRRPGRRMIINPSQAQGA
ncbi:MAG TPA: sulfotransferase [Acidimicrobiales bacterium]|nr:sulfotransferase [Acidimicrobiales bacterium]